MGWIFVLFCGLIFMWIMVSVGLGRRIPFFKWVGLGFLFLLWSVSAVVLILRFTGGLGAVTGLSDGFPWGIWIGLDVLSGVALAAGGYVLAATVHLFKIERFEPILRPTILTAFLGYIIVAAAILIDIGRPYRLWHPLVMWQHHSIMFEVSWCVTLYSTVLAIEFSPVLFEKLNLQVMLKWTRRIAIPVVVIGVILSTLHQSSLGSMFLIIPQKLNPLWYSPLLPVFFLISSVAVGMCVIVIESFFSSKVFGRSLEKPLLTDLGRAASVVLFFYFTLRMVDVVARDAGGEIAAHPALGFSFGVELLIGALLPAILLSLRNVREQTSGLLLAAFLAGGGVVLNLFNVSWFGLLPYTGNVYRPAWMEFLISFLLISVAIVAFGLAVKYLPVFPEARQVE